MSTTTIAINVEDYDILSELAIKNGRKLISQFHFILKDYEEKK